MTCRYEGCLGKVTARKMCQKHYRRVLKYGSPDIVHKAGGKTKPLGERFWKLVTIADPTECWVWNGLRIVGGYGLFRLSGTKAKHMVAHKMAYTLTHGSVPEGLELDHLCRNTACVNPAHLEPVTHQTNALRGRSFAFVNAAKTHCHRGHPFDLINTYRVPSNPQSRHCRACAKIRELSFRQRHRLPPR